MADGQGDLTNIVPNYGIGTDIGGLTGQGGIVGSPVPIAVPPGVGSTGNVGTQSQQAISALDKLIALQRQVSLPQQLPPKQTEPGDLSRLYSPFSPGSTKHNEKVAIAQSIGQLLSGIENRYEQKKARDIAYDAERLQQALSVDTPANRDLANQILYKNGDQNQGLSKRGKELQKALDLDLGSLTSGTGKDDTPQYIRQAQQQIFNPQQANRSELDSITQQAQQQQAQGQQPQQQPANQAAQQQQLQYIMRMAQQAQAQQAQAQQGQPQPGQAVPTPGGMSGGGGIPTAAPTAGGTPQVIPQTGAGGGGGAPAPQAIQQRVARPASAYDALQRSMPQTIGLTPEAQAQAALVKAGVLPSADKLTDQQIKNAEMVTKVAMTNGLIDQRQREALLKAITSEDRTKAVAALAGVGDLTKIITNRATTGAYNARTQMMGKIADQKASLQANVSLIDNNIKDLTTQEAAARRQASNAKLSDDERAAANAQADSLDKSLQAMRTVSEQMRQQINQVGTILNSTSLQDSGTAPDAGQQQSDPELKSITDWLLSDQ